MLRYRRRGNIYKTTARRFNILSRRLANVAIIARLVPIAEAKNTHYDERYGVFVL